MSDTRETLNERQRVVLEFLAARPGAAMRAGGGWTEDEGVYAFHVDDQLVAKGLTDRNRPGSRGYVPTGTANTLSALRRRGLVEFAASPGCFVQARWRISDAGAQLVKATADGR